MQDHPTPNATPRVAGNEDLDQIASVFAIAFRNDPTWGPLLAPTDKGVDVAFDFWRFFIDSAPRFPFTFITGDAASVWYPPGAEEFTPEQHEQLEPFLDSLLGAKRAAQLLTTSERFDAARPSDAHFFLSMLASHPNSRGKGYGMALLANNLGVIDALGMPTYLESSNPANDARYERLGYRRHGTIDLPSGNEITTMWRDPAPLSSN